MGMDRHETQRQRIRRYLLDGNSITPIDALRKFGAFRLADHIFQLKKRYGMDVVTEMIYDDGKRYAKYYLRREA